LYELPVNDLELAGCGVVAEKGGAGRVEGGGLDVFVEVWGGDGADPVVAALQCFSGAGA
jgi:hypothetical protein